MNGIVRALIGTFVVALAVAGGGAASAAGPEPVTAAAPAPVAAPAATSAPLMLPAVSAADAVVDARAAVDTAQAAALAAAEVRAAQEQAQRDYAEHLSIGDNAVGPDYCDPYTGMKLNGTPCSSGQVQYEYWTDPGQAALQACREQTGMTTAECQADAAAGNAS